MKKNQFLVKTYAEKNHAEAFIQGTMFANPLSHFKKLEDGNVRRDSEEGIVTMPLTEGFKAEISPSGFGQRIVMTRDDLAAPLTIQPRWFDTINLFCMHIVETERKEGDTWVLKMPTRATSFGRHAVVIWAVAEFIRRVKEATVRSGYQLGYGPVKYYDPTIGIHTDLSTLEPVFTKRNDYQEEQEFRMAIARPLVVPTPLELNIGSIQDITQLVEM